MYVKNVEELVVYKISIQLAKEIKNLVYKIPRYWNIVEIDQILRSSSSSPSNIAEGFGVRFYPRKLLLYLNNALASSDETQNHLRLLFLKNYITEQDLSDLKLRYKNLSIKLLNWIIYLKKRHDILI